MKWQSHPELIPGSVEQAVLEAKFFILRFKRWNQSPSLFAALEEHPNSWQGFTLKIVEENGVPPLAVNAWLTSLCKEGIDSDYQHGAIEFTQDIEKAYEFLVRHRC